MGSLSPLKWLTPFFAVLVALALLAASQAPAPLDDPHAVSALDYWLERYQALTAGLLALTAGGLALTGILMQVRSTERRHEVEQQNLMENAFQARAALADSLSGEIFAIAQLATDVGMIALGSYTTGKPISADLIRVNEPMVYKSSAHELGTFVSPFFTVAIPMFYARAERWRAEVLMAEKVATIDTIKEETKTFAGLGFEIA